MKTSWRLLVSLSALTFVTVPFGKFLGDDWSLIPGVNILRYAVVEMAWILPFWYFSRVLVNFILRRTEKPIIRGVPILTIVVYWVVLRFIALFLIYSFLLTANSEAIMRYINES